MDPYGWRSEEQSYWTKYNVYEEEETTPTPKAEVDPIKSVEDAVSDFLGIQLDKPVEVTPTPEAATPAQPSGISDKEMLELMQRVKVLRGMEKATTAQEVAEVQKVIRPAMTGGTITHSDLYARIRQDFEAGLSDTNLPMIQAYLAATRAKM